MNWIRQKLRELVAWITGSVDEIIPEKAKLEADAQRMMTELQKQKDAVTMSMAQALNAKERLQEKVIEIQNFEAQAKDFLKQGREDLAARILELQEQAKKDLELLTSQYESLKSTAESAVLQYKKNEDQVNQALKKIDSLKLQSELNKIQESVQKTLGSFDLNNPLKSFQKTEERIKLKSQQIQASAALTGSTLNAMKQDAEISSALKNLAIQNKLAQLKKQLDDEAGVIDAEIVDDTVDKAMKALNAPTFLQPNEQRINLQLKKKE